METPGVNRRKFLALSLLPTVTAPLLLRTSPSNAPEVLVVGGGLGGCAAALAAVQCGRRVLLAVEDEWLGGQWTSQAAPPDEHPWIETHGCTRTYRALRDAIRDHYRRHEPLAPPFKTAPDLNPGNCWVSRLGCEPRIAAAVLERQLAPWVRRGRLQILRHQKAVRAAVEQDHVRSVVLQNQRTGDEIEVKARYFLDATDLGELLPLAGAEWVIGAESATETDELHAPARAQPASQQAFTWAMALEYLPGEDHRTTPPPEYPFWRDYAPKTQPPWTGPLFSWEGPNPATLIRRRLGFNPAGTTIEPNLWTYRRIREATQFQAAPGNRDISVINWPQNDYLGGPLVGGTSQEAEIHRKGSRRLSLCFLHWLQTEAPRTDGGTGWPGLRACPGVLGSDDGLALAPYIRESRRIRSELTLTEKHLGVEQRLAGQRARHTSLGAEPFPDSVGIGAYRIDLHPTPSGDNYLDISSFPFQIPLGALIPVRLQNLLPAAKNFGTTHISNGCCRLHPVEWNVGEAAGHLAAFSLEIDEPPRFVRNHPKRRAEFQKRLVDAGVELDWPKEQRTVQL